MEPGRPPEEPRPPPPVPPGLQQQPAVGAPGPAIQAQGPYYGAPTTTPVPANQVTRPSYDPNQAPAAGAAISAQLPPYHPPGLNSRVPSSIFAAANPAKSSYGQQVTTPQVLPDRPQARDSCQALPQSAPQQSWQTPGNVPPAVTQGYGYQAQPVPEGPSYTPHYAVEAIYECLCGLIQQDQHGRQYNAICQLHAPQVPATTVVTAQVQ